MTLRPVAPPHLLTVAEYLEIGEIELGYSELTEGRLLMSPSPVPDHNRAGFRFAVELDRRLPPGLEVIPDMDVDLQLATPDAPGTVRFGAVTSGYGDDGAVTGTFTATAPFAVEIDLDALR